MSVRLQLHDQVFYLNDPAEIEQVRADIETAVRASGAFVRIGSLTGPEIMVTRAMLIRIDVVPDELLDDEQSDASSEPAFVDFDLYAVSA